MTPSFDWNTTEQYDDFQLFHKSVESWFTLQNIPAETAPGAGPDAEPNSTWLEYVLNFLGNTGCRKFDHWKPTGTADETSKKKQASAFMDYLSSMMDHAVSQCCRIYQLEYVCIQPGESPDELIDHLCALADQCNFPSDEEKEWNVQYRHTRALNDKELIEKLLALNLKATTPKMLKVCWTHIAISDNLEAMGLKEQKSVNAIRKQYKPHQAKKPPADSVHSCGHCTKFHPPGQSSCPAWDDICHGCGKKGHWKPKCQSGNKGPKDKAPKYHNWGGRQKKVNEVGTDEDPHCDEVGVIAVVLQTSPHMEWLTTGHKRNGADPETIGISDVQIDSTTEAFVTVQMPAEIGPKELVTLKCKVDTSAGSNIIPLCVFAKLFPRHINTDGSPRGLKSSMTHLTAYNRSKIPQFGTLYTAIDWTPKGQKVANCLQTWWYIAETPGPAILGTPIMCQTWHCGTQLCSQPPAEEIGAAEETHNRMQKSQRGPSRPETSTPQHKRRPHQGISGQIWRNWLFPRTILHHPIQWCKTCCTCTSDVPDCYAATGVRKTRWVHGTRNHHPSGGAHGLGILTHLLLESKWQAESLFGSPRCQQSHQKRPLQDTHHWRDNTSTGRKQEVYQGQWNLIIPLHSPWLWIFTTYHI